MKHARQCKKVDRRQNCTTLSTEAALHANVHAVKKKCGKKKKHWWIE